MLSLDNLNFDQSFTLYPNPSNGKIQILGLDEQEPYKIYNILGSEIKKRNNF